MLTAGWLGAVLADHTVTQPQHPLAHLAGLGTPLLLFWMPLAGCLLGAAAGSAALMTAPPGSGWSGWHGLACAVVAGWLLLAVGVQRRLIRTASDRTSAPVPDTLRQARGPDRRGHRTWVGPVASVLGLAGLGLLVGNGVSVRNELAVATLAAAVLLAGQEGWRRRTWRRLMLHPQPAMRVRASSARAGARLYPALDDTAPSWGSTPDRQRPVAVLGLTGSRPDLRASSDDPAWPDADVVLLGDLRAGGWVVMVTDQGVDAPRRLQPGPSGWWFETRAALARLNERRAARYHDRHPERLRRGRPPESAPDDAWKEIPVPLTMRPSGQEVLIGIGCISLGLVFGWLAVLDIRGGLAHSKSVLLLVMAPLWVFFGSSQVFDRVRLTHESLTLHRGLDVIHLPLHLVEQARRHGTQVTVKWSGGSDRVSVNVPGLWLSTEAQAKQVATLIMALRQEAVAAGGTGGRRSRRLGPTWLLLAAYLMVVILTWRATG